MKITMNVGERLGAALAAQAAANDMEVPGYLKSLLFAAAHSPQGIVLKLDLPPAKQDGLPLFEARGVSLPTEP